jgi:hypothetical protein
LDAQASDYMIALAEIQNGKNEAIGSGIFFRK